MPEPTLVHRVLGRAGATVLNHLPVPLPVARLGMLGENAVENRRGGWDRLRDGSEDRRYRTVRLMLNRHARDGFVLDVGCSQGILQEGLGYRRYVGVDHHAPTVHRAQAGKGDARTAFVHADAAAYVPDEAPDAVVFSEVLYYLAQPVRVVERYAGLLAPGGVVLVSCYARTWPTRRLLQRLTRRLDVVEGTRVVAEPHAWDVAVLRPRA